MKVTNKRLDDIPVYHRLYFYDGGFYSNFHDLDKMDFLFDYENIPIKIENVVAKTCPKIKKILRTKL